MSFAPDKQMRKDPDFDVVVVGAGIGGIYAMHRFRKQGLSVLGIEGAPDVGGVWYHNRYPGARVDVESYYYCYYDEELYRGWTWSERYPAQPEILAYLNYAADTFKIRDSFWFDTWVVGAQWDPVTKCYTVTTDTGTVVTCRFLVLTTGQLSKAREPDMPGLSDFQGQWVLTSHWPVEPVEMAGKRIGVVGTGSSGIQVIPALAELAGELYVFQRTPNYSAPAHNSPLDQAKYAQLSRELEKLWEDTIAHPAGMMFPLSEGPSTKYGDEERISLLRERWSRYGGHTMNTIFSDQGTVLAANDVVAEFIRSKVLEIVDDPEVAASLSPNAYPLGSRRLALDTKYYETFNRENVTLVDLRRDPIERITETGIQTRERHVALDLIVFALGFEAFTGALDAVNVRNESGMQPSDYWSRGPRTFLGLMTSQFPNLFIMTGPGSPSVLANLVTGNVQHVDFVADLIAYMDERGLVEVVPSEEAEGWWTARVAEVAEPLIRRQVNNFMVHVNHDDKSRVFIPYAGGLGRYVAECEAVAASDYKGLIFS